MYLICINHPLNENRALATHRKTNTKSYSSLTLRKVRFGEGLQPSKPHTFTPLREAGYSSITYSTRPAKMGLGKYMRLCYTTYTSTVLDKHSAYEAQSLTVY